METFEVYKFIHILAAMAWVGGALFAQVMALRMANADPVHRLHFAKDLHFVAKWVFVPSAIVIFLAGLLAIEEARPGFDYDQTWIAIGVVGVLVSLLIAVAFLIPQLRKGINLIESSRNRCPRVMDASSFAHFSYRMPIAEAQVVKLIGVDRLLGNSQINDLRPRRIW